jgi:hypothetical protein
MNMYCSVPSYQLPLSCSIKLSPPQPRNTINISAFHGIGQCQCGSAQVGLFNNGNTPTNPQETSPPSSNSHFGLADTETKQNSGLLNPLEEQDPGEVKSLPTKEAAIKKQSRNWPIPKKQKLPISTTDYGAHKQLTTTTNSRQQTTGELT